MVWASRLGVVKEVIRLQLGIDNILGTRSDKKGRVRGTGMVGEKVEVVAKSGRRAGYAITPGMAGFTVRSITL